MDDPALATLLLPFADGELSWPDRGRSLFLRARYGAPLEEGVPDEARARLLCRQSFRPDALALQRAGFVVEAEPPDDGSEAGAYDLILLLAPRQRQEARALMAAAVEALAPDGLLVVSQPNLEGARSGEGDLAALIGPLQSRSKHKCRVFWGRRPATVRDPARLQEWLALDTPRRLEEGGFLTRPGLFAWDRIDAGSSLLARHLPGDLAGRAADLGCGFGYLAAELLARAPGILALDLYEAELRALRLAEANLAGRAGGLALDFLWQDVTEGLERRYDTIVSNPPFHQRRAQRSDLGQAFVAAAAAALLPGGRFWLVANRHLPYEAALHQGFDSHRVVVEEGGFKVIEALAAVPSARRRKGRR